MFSVNLNSFVQNILASRCISINCTYIHFTSLPIIRISMLSIFFFEENISLNVVFFFITRLRKSANSFSIFVSEGENINVCMQIKRCLNAQYRMVNINDLMVRKNPSLAAFLQLKK